MCLDAGAPSEGQLGCHLDSRSGSAFGQRLGPSYLHSQDGIELGLKNIL